MATASDFDPPAGEAAPEQVIQGTGEHRAAPFEFAGRRGQLLGVLLRGFLLMVPTLGIYRFWVVTAKRQFYWQNTVIDGDPLEYSGTARQLLLGFLFALGFFLPIYVAFFYLSTQSQEIAVLGYLAAAVVLWFMTGYAAYRGRDFRLSRTLWRGIRFDQRGNAWGYALRRLLWAILTILTLGLAYPFMAASLWRYRYRNTWYGDRQLGMKGGWRQLAGPFYLVYFGTSGLILASLAYIAGSGDYVLVPELDNFAVPGPAATALLIADAVLILFGIQYFRARSISRMLSSVEAGTARLSVRVRARSLMGLYFGYAATLFGLLVVLAIAAGLIAVAILTNSMVIQGSLDLPDPAFFQNGWAGVALLVAGYLIVFGTLGLLAELIFGYGYWRIVARGTVIENIASLDSVRAGAEDGALAGEGLADALNAGSY